MSEIRERAQEWIKNETDPCWLFDCLGEEEGQQCVDAGYVIRDLLAELERVENDTAKVKLAYAEGKITGRQQAARECIEIIDKYPAFLFGADAVGVKLNLSQSIKAHFAIKGE